MQAQYRQYPQNVPPHPQRSPHVPQPQARRGGIGPMMSSGPDPRVPLTQAQVAQQHQAQIAATERAKIRSRKPTDRTMPDGVDDIVIGDGVQRYRDLREFERHLDATVTRKRLDIVESTSRNAKRFKTMRVWINNTVENQPWQREGGAAETFDFNGTQDATFKVKIEGKLLDDERDDADAEDPAGADADMMDTDEAKAAADSSKTLKPPRPCFSSFFRAISVDFSRSRARNGAEHSVEWRKPERNPNAPPPTGAEFDEFVFKRSGDENTNVIINLYRQEEPERYQLSLDLADVVDMTTGTRPEIVMALWEYIKLMRLQEDEEKRNFRCDEVLRKIIGGDVGWIPALGEYINRHIQPLPPVALPYTIRVDEDFSKDPQPTVYDIRVAVADPLRQNLFNFIHNPQYVNMLKEIVTLDDKLATMVQAVADSKAKHQFLQSIMMDPTNFTREWMSSQKRDLDIIMGEANARGGGSEDTAGDEWRRGGKNSVWATQNARESVNVLLSKLPVR